VTNFTLDHRRARTIQWLERIFKDVQDLMVDHHIFWAVQDIIKSNEVLTRTPSHFYQWMGTNFTASAAIAVRRQADNDKQAVSLRGLLEELKTYPQLFSRQYHTGLYKAPGMPKDYADSCYDRIVGEGRTELDPAMVQIEIDDLVAKTDAIKHYVDRKIAHYDPRGLTQAVPTFNDLEDAIRVLDTLVRRYHLIMKGGWMNTLMPVFQYDWQDIFKVAWIREPERPRDESVQP
jgi:hypothetical protein